MWLADDAFQEHAYKSIAIVAQWRLRCPLHHLLNNLCHLLNMRLSQVGEEDTEMAFLLAPYRFEHATISGSGSECSSGDSDSDNDIYIIFLVSFSLMVSTFTILSSTQAHV